MMALVDLTTGSEQLFSLTHQRKRLYSECGALVTTEQGGSAGVDDSPPPSPSKRNNNRTGPKPSGKNVRFSNADIVTVFHVVPEEVCATLWYQKDDYQRIRQETKDTIVMFEKLGCSLDAAMLDDTYCLRGLEGVVGALVFRMMRHRNQKIVNSVLCQQHLLRQNGRADDIEALRLSSTVISMFDKRKAWIRAQNSEKFVL